MFESFYAVYCFCQVSSTYVIGGNIFEMILLTAYTVCLKKMHQL